MGHADIVTAIRRARSVRFGLTLNLKRKWTTLNIRLSSKCCCYTAHPFVHIHSCKPKMFARTEPTRRPFHHPFPHPFRRQANCVKMLLLINTIFRFIQLCFRIILCRISGINMMYVCNVMLKCGRSFSVGEALRRQSFRFEWNIQWGAGADVLRRRRQWWKKYRHLFSIPFTSILFALQSHQVNHSH